MDTQPLVTKVILTSPPLVMFTDYGPFTIAVLESKINLLKNNKARVFIHLLQLSSSSTGPVPSPKVATNWSSPSTG